MTTKFRFDGAVLYLTFLRDKVPPAVRLRGLLKLALRRFRLRCARIDGQIPEK